jgi:predicted O-linked N-acetylglucosamine transferase (SPINDLY family)
LLVFARKPAPVQATWLGYMNTTGLSTVDYRITDNVLDPIGGPCRDTEELVRLPAGMCCFAPPVDAPEVAPLPALKNRLITFGSLHRLFKLNARVFDLWSKVLNAVEHARLLMFHHTLKGEVAEYIRGQFKDHGITGERLELRCGSAAPGYLGIYGEIDISLDTFPCTGGVTTCESLWMGVPVMTLCGVRPASRNSAALLSRAGLSDWVAQTPEEYVGLAVQRTKVLNDLSQLRAGMRDRIMPTLCDAQRFTRTLEDAYRSMWLKKLESGVRGPVSNVQTDDSQDNPRTPDSGPSAIEHNNSALGLLSQGKLEEAIAQFRQAIRSQPAFPEAHNNLANVLFGMNRADEAVVHYQKALELTPDYAEAHNNLGSALMHLGNQEEAESHFRQALRLKPESADIHCNLGNALRILGKAQEAEEYCRNASKIRPDYAEAHNHLGSSLLDQNKIDEAIPCFRKALQIKPQYAAAHCNLGDALDRFGRLDDAYICYRHALRFNPRFAEAHNNLGGILLRRGQLREALDSFRQALHFQPNMVSAQHNLLACSNYDPDADLDAVFAAHRDWGQKKSEVFSPKSEVEKDWCDIGHRTSDIRLDPQRLLRIGYVSPDLRRHAVTRYLEPVLANHDPKQVEVYCYAEVRNEDEVTTRLQGLAHGWRSTCGLRDTHVADQIHADRIDILVDLAGHSANNRLDVFALKPAPIQATWLGYLNTTGLATLDYRLTDDILDPLDQPVRDTEELLRLSGGMCCFAPPADAPAIGRLPALGRGHVTFGSLHGLVKVNSRVLDLWSRVLHAVTSSKLLMFHHTLTAGAQEQILREFSARGIEKERLWLRKGSGLPGYLSVYNEIDVTLDTFPYTGGVTTCESLWMGVPVLSICGIRPAGRHSTALLTRVGLGDWSVQAPEQYVAAATKRSSDLERLANLRSSLRKSVTNALCDAERFTRVLENAYRAIWRRWCASSAKSLDERSN